MGSRLALLIVLVFYTLGCISAPLKVEHPTPHWNLIIQVRAFDHDKWWVVEGATVYINGKWAESGPTGKVNALVAGDISRVWVEAEGYASSRPRYLPQGSHIIDIYPLYQAD